MCQLKPATFWQNVVADSGNSVHWNREGGGKKIAKSAPKCFLINQVGLNVHVPPRNIHFMYPKWLKKQNFPESSHPQVHCVMHNALDARVAQVERRTQSTYRILNLLHTNNRDAILSCPILSLLWQSTTL